jgi:hypothetical protein
MKRELAPHGRGVVVLFSDRRFDKRAGEPTGEELRRDLPLRLVERVADGAIYELAR